MKRTVNRTEVLLAILLIITLLFFLVFIGFWTYFGRWQGQVDSRCNDNLPCTLDEITPNGCCIHGLLANDTYCSNEDVCFNSTCGAAYCNANGVCEGQRACCRGICDFDEDCPLIPWSPRLDDNPLGQCISHSCVYTIVGSLTAACNSWIDNPPDNPLEAQGCIIFRFSDAGFNFIPGICLYRYSCATFDFSSKRAILMDEDEIYNKSMEAIDFFKSNNLLFHDMPNYGPNLIHLHNEFSQILNNSKTWWSTGIPIADLKHKNKKHPQTNHKQIENHLLKKSKIIN